MTAQIRSELLKVRTTTTALVVLAAAAAVTALGTGIEGLSPTLRELAAEDAQREMFGAGVTAVFFASLVGVLAVTSEFRYGTIRSTLLVEPRRSRVFAAKLVVAALTGAAVGVACVAVAFGGGFAVLAARDVDVALSSGHALLLVLGPVAASAMSASVGVAIGALIRDQTGAVVALVVYAFLVDATLFAAAPSVGRFLPGKASDALAGRPVDDLLAPGVGAAVFALWAAAFVVAALRRTERSDV